MGEYSSGVGHLSEKALDSQTLYQGRIIEVRKDTVLLENGTITTREVIHHPGGVGIVPLTDEGEVYMVRQFRYPYHTTLWEIPAGKLSEGEDPLSCGRRELLEETGCTAQEMLSLGCMYPSAGYVDEVIHLYLARGLSVESQSLDDDEFLDVESFPLDRLVQMVLSGEIRDAKTQIAVLKTKLLLDNQTK